MRRWAAAIAAVGTLLTGHTANAQGVDLTARTVYHAYQLQLAPDADGGLRDLNRFYQTLEAAGWALVPDQKIDAVLSMRYLTDFGTGFLRNTPVGVGIPAVDGRNDLQLLYAYVEWRDAFDLLDLRFGRQVRIDDLAWASFDGLDVTAHFYKNGEDYVDLSVYAGIPVQIDVLFSSETFVGDGIEVYDGSGFLNGLTFGGEAAVRLIRDLSASVAYRQTVVFRDDNIDSFLGLDAAASASDGRIGLQEHAVGASLGYTIREADLNLYGSLMWDLLFGQLDRARAGGAWQPGRNFTVRGEYLRVRPWFVGDSIFNYFNIFAYDKGRTEVAWEITKGLRVTGGYFLQIFNGGEKGPQSTAGPGPNAGATFGGSDLVHGPSAGVTYRHPRFGLGANIEASTNVGGDYAYGGNYRLLQVFGDVSFLGGRITTDARLAVTTFQNDWIEGRDQGVVDDPNTSLIGSVGARAQLAKFLTARLLLAKNINSQLAGSYRVFSELAVRY